MSVAKIVILNWNGTDHLRRFLPSVVSAAPEGVEVIVADNGSTDDSVAVLKAEFPTVTCLCMDRNYGFAEGYNRALRHVEADYYLLLNSDIEVTHHWLTPLLEFMDAHPEAAACQPKLLSLADRDCFEYAGACGGFIDRYGYPFCRGRIFDTVERDGGQYDYRQEIFWATGAAMMVRSADYWRAGGLDGRFFAHNEEIDLCWRLRLMGRKIFCIPESCVYHVGGGTLPKGNPMKTFLNFRNNLTMLYKCLPENELRHVMRVRWVLDYVAAFEMLLLKGSLGDFKAVWRARRAFARWKAGFADDRRRIQASCVVKGIAERRPFMLLWQYYGRGKKRFSDL